MRLTLLPARADGAATAYDRAGVLWRLDAGCSRWRVAVRDPAGGMLYVSPGALGAGDVLVTIDSAAENYRRG